MNTFDGCKQTMFIFVFVQDCSGQSQGEQVCSTVYETECWTKQNVHEVTKTIKYSITLFAKTLSKMSFYSGRAVYDL